jgi:hypothetical protein
MSKQRRKRHTPEQIVAKLRDAPSCNSLLGSREAAKPRRHGEPIALRSLTGDPVNFFRWVVFFSC